MKAVKFLACLALIGLAVCLGAGIWFNHAYNGVRALPEGKVMLVTPGSSVSRIARELHADGIITSPLAFKIGARYQQIIAPERAALKAGEYALPAAASTHDILRILRVGDTLQRRITIPEGLMAVEIVELLKAADGLEGEIINIPAEGSLLPETYHYTRGTQRADLIARMEKSMQATLDMLWETRAADLPFDTKEEAVTLAAIVEKETALAAERPRVAGVFINRLRKGMKLQTDPTVIYALTEGKQRLGRALLRRDLEVDSPYNTYKYAGLPPGPIANPGRASLAAVLNPEAHEDLFFVADGTGGHAFAPTLQLHNRNVVKWRRHQQKARANAAAAAKAAEQTGNLANDEILEAAEDAENDAAE